MKQCMMGEVAIGTNPCMAHGMPKAVTKACGASARTEPAGSGIRA
jgi:hypothetical protein